MNQMLTLFATVSILAAGSLHAATAIDFINQVNQLAPLDDKAAQATFPKIPAEFNENKAAATPLTNQQILQIAQQKLGITTPSDVNRVLVAPFNTPQFNLTVDVSSQLSAIAACLNTNKTLSSTDQENVQHQLQKLMQRKRTLLWAQAAAQAAAKINSALAASELAPS